MNLFLMLILASMIAIIILIILILTLKPLAPFDKIKKKDLDKYYDMNTRRYKKK